MPEPGRFDKIIHRLRNRIERFVNLMRHFRPLASLLAMMNPPKKLSGLVSHRRFAPVALMITS